MGARLVSHMGDLVRDMERIPVKAKVGMVRIVAANARQGNRTAKAFARHSAGRHGVHYPDAMTAEPRGDLAWEYGPDAAMPQGGMSFEWGSRNQKPHLDLNRSADIQGPALGRDVADLVDRLYW